ncbi:Protein RecA (plasmid) [Bacillus cereus]|nr:Protein RecA [Bacillus cereus]
MYEFTFRKERVYVDDERKSVRGSFKKNEKDFWEGAIMKLGERLEQKISVVSSGSIGLDIALGEGGYPKGPHY